jgi:uncharacterized protein (TIGR02145 family)
MRTTYLLLLCFLTTCSSPTSAPPTYTLQVSVSPTEGGSVTPNGGTYKDGQQVSVLATPSPGWRFDRWQGDHTSTQNPVSITMTKNMNITAIFQGLAPTVVTGSVSNVTTTSATVSGSVTVESSIAVTSRGVCYATTQNPTTSNTCVASGSGAGSFSANLTGLTAGVRYYARAYATSASGTNYGSQVDFTTLTSSGTWSRDNTTAVVEVTNPATGRVWMDRNLGATQAATSFNDTQAYGHLYQWGRAADGHQNRNSTTTTIIVNSSTPGHGNFILNPNSPWDWRIPQDNSLWQGANGTNNPCPVGFRIPTDAEWNAERLSWSSNNRAGAIASPLKLPIAGPRNHSNGSTSNLGSYGYYWSSSIDGSSSLSLLFASGNAFMSGNVRASGASVRCIKN